MSGRVYEGVVAIHVLGQHLDPLTHSPPAGGSAHALAVGHGGRPRQGQLMDQLVLGATAFFAVIACQRCPGQDSTVLMCRSCQGPYAGHHKQLPFQASSHEHCMVSRHVKVLKVLHELEEVVPCPRPGDFRT